MNSDLREVCIEKGDDIACVAILKLNDNLDAANYAKLITQARTLYENGQRVLLLDLRSVSKLGTAGLFALRSIVSIYRGQEPPSPESGWAALKNIRNHEDAHAPAVKFFSAGPQVRELLVRASFSVYDDLISALRTL